MSFKLISDIRLFNFFIIPLFKGSYFKAYFKIYFYKLKISKNKVVIYEVSYPEGLRADYLSVVMYIGH